MDHKLKPANAQSVPVDYLDFADDLSVVEISSNRTVLVGQKEVTVPS
jgi:hypothetical protein